MRKANIHKNTVLDNYILNTTDKSKLDKLKQLMGRFNRLPVNRQAYIMETLEKKFEQAILKEEMTYFGDEICQKEGHIYTEWEDKVFEDKYFDEAGWCEVTEKHPYQKRKCERCGITETRTNE